MDKEEFRKIFAKQLQFSCQKFGCPKNKNHGCTAEDKYPCPEVLPTYILTVFEKRWERHQKAEQIEQDRGQSRLNFGGGM